MRAWSLHGRQVERERVFAAIPSGLSGPLIFRVFWFGFAGRRQTLGVNQQGALVIET